MPRVRVFLSFSIMLLVVVLSRPTGYLNMVQIQEKEAPLRFQKIFLS